MKQGFAAVLGCLILLLSPFMAPGVEAATPVSIAIAQTGRVRLNFNADWQFRLGSIDGGEAETFDDSGWEPVGLPHSFGLPYFRAPDFYTGDGWYRKTFTLPVLPVGRRLSLEFEGAFQDALPASLRSASWDA